MSKLRFTGLAAAAVVSGAVVTGMIRAAPAPAIVSEPPSPIATSQHHSVEAALEAWCVIRDHQCDLVGIDVTSGKRLPVGPNRPIWLRLPERARSVKVDPESGCGQVDRVAEHSPRSWSFFASPRLISAGGCDVDVEVRYGRVLGVFGFATRVEE